MIILRKALEIKTKQNYNDLYLAFQKLRENIMKEESNVENIELKQEASSIIFQTLKYFMRNNLRSSFLKIKGYAKLSDLLKKNKQHEEEAKNTHRDSLLIEKNIIINQVNIS